MKTSSKSSKGHKVEDCMKSLTKKRVFININSFNKKFKYTSIFVNSEGKPVKTNVEEEVFPKSICVHNAIQLGNGSLGKLDFLRSQGFTISGWTNYNLYNKY